jgi:outer membrane protein assembly complex protein YaeT
MIAAVSLILAAAAQQPQQEDWDGKTIVRVLFGRDQGWVRHRFAAYQDRLHLRPDRPYTRAQRDADLRELFASGNFDWVDIIIEKRADGWVARVKVIEYPIVHDVVFTGVTAIPIKTLTEGLRLRPNDNLNPYHLKLDEAAIREQYLMKGHYFFNLDVEKIPVSGSPDSVILHWRIFEGPVVRVRDIIIHGIPEEDAADVRRILVSRDRSTLFGLVTVGSEPFVQHFLEEDLKRIRFYFFQQGWLDIYNGERVFLEDLVFTRDKTQVDIILRADRGRRYKLRQVTFAGNTVFTAEQLQAALLSKPGTDYSDDNAARDIGRIRDLYGERAYIMAEVDAKYVVSADAPEVSLAFTIVENQEVTIGRIVIQGNTKTRYDVILRELRDFTPGDKFNNRKLLRGVAALRDKGYFEPGAGVLWRHEPGLAPNERDVIIDVKEGTTGNIRFAGGFSSSFGILGILEFTQRNFDITDLPKSVEDLFSGDAFAGGGQVFRIRAAPAARRQQFLVEFREPYVFGYEFGAGARGIRMDTVRRSWEEERGELSFSVDKRLDPFRLELRWDLSQIEIKDIDLDAPSDAFDVTGLNRIYSVVPGIAFDTRNSVMFPSEGVRVSLAYEYAGGPLGGDWDFGKLLFGTEVHFTLHETEERLKHVLTFEFRFNAAEPFRRADEIPIFERFYAGGRDSIRGFEFRGVGPHELDEPIGGSALVQGSIEYSFPLLVETLRGAFFYDIANLARELNELDRDKFRNSIGFGIRFIIPQLGNIPVALDFGFPLTREDFDERQTVTFDIGKLF